MVTLFGKSNTAYEIGQTTNTGDANPWPLGWSITVPASLFIQTPAQGTLSNASVLFLNAKEQ